MRKKKCVSGTKTVRKKMLIGMLLCLGMTVIWGCGKDGGKDEIKEKIQEQGTEADYEEQNIEDMDDAVTNTAESESAKGESTQIQEETSVRELSEEMLQEINYAKTRHYYGDILSGLLWAGELPGMQVEMNDDFYDTVRDNRFAVTDIDNDGREELLISYSTASMAGMFLAVYDYNPSTNQLKQQLCLYPSLSFYDNGMIKAEASHNHSRGEFWPFGLYQYQKDSDTYEMVASVGTWDKEFTDSWGDGQPFPEELDVDGDGVLYNIQRGNNPAYEYADYKYNQSDYDVFYQTMMQAADGAGVTADEIQIDFIPLTYESFKEYTPAYLRLLHEAGRRESDVDQTDIGFLFLEEERTLYEVEQFLSEQYGVVIVSQEEEYDDFMTGTYRDKQIFEFIHLDGGDLTYRNEKIEDITIFGIYPGMHVDKAWERLTAYGFYANPDAETENSLITGVGMGNRSIYFEAEDQIINNITVRPYCKYTG